MPAPSTYVIIATKGRAETLSQLLHHLQRQSCPPTGIIVSACSPSDILQVPDGIPNKVVLGPPGLTSQRNRALSMLPPDADYVIFFDDDFIPSDFWIERVQRFFAVRLDATSVTGLVLVDGVKTGGIAWLDGLAMVEAADRKAGDFDARKIRARSGRSPYGCNMAYRFASIRGLTFDERLVNYGWLEDRDFGARAVRRSGAAFWTDAVWGAHIGIRGARVSGTSFGYSQIVNPWYLFKKGVVTFLETAFYMGNGILTNSVRSVFKDSKVDRRGRLIGNLLGISDIISSCWRPEKAAEL